MPRVVRFRIGAILFLSAVRMRIHAMFYAFNSYLCDFHNNIAHPLPQKEHVIVDLPADPLSHEERLRLWRQSVEEVQAQPTAEYTCPTFSQSTRFAPFF
jgi:hypothetical protein